MIEINLLPEELRKKETIKFALPENFNRRALSVFFAVFVGGQLLLYGLVLYQGAEFAGMKRTAASLKEETRDIAVKKSETVLMKARLKEIATLTQRNFYWSSLLNTISDSMAKGVWLRRFSIIEEERKSAPSPSKNTSAVVKGAKPAAAATQKVHVLKLEGSVVGNSGQETDYVVKFARELKTNPWFGSLFSEIELFNINQRKIKTFDVYDFTLECVFKKEKF